jgi:hypothetical protein
LLQKEFLEKFIPKISPRTKILLSSNEVMISLTNALLHPRRFQPAKQDGLECVETKNKLRKIILINGNFIILVLLMTRSHREKRRFSGHPTKLVFLV